MQDIPDGIIIKYLIPNFSDCIKNWILKSLFNFSRTCNNYKGMCSLMLGKLKEIYMLKKEHDERVIMAICNRTYTRSAERLYWLQVLINSGENINENITTSIDLTYIHYTTPLIFVICETTITKRKDDIIQFLLSQHSIIDVNKEDSNALSPLHHAGKTLNVFAVKSLLCHTNINVNKRDIDSTTPLMFTLTQGYEEENNPTLPEIVKLFVKHPGIDINAFDKEQDTALHMAIKLIDNCAMNNDSMDSAIKATMELLKHPNIERSVNKHNDAGFTPRHLLVDLLEGMFMEHRPITPILSDLCGLFRVGLVHDI